MKQEFVEPVTYKQLLSLFKKLDEREQEKLFNSLKKERFNALLKSLRESIGKIPLSFDDITMEVEKVRQQQYENRKRK